LSRFVQTRSGVLNAAFLRGGSRFLVIASLQGGSQQEGQRQGSQDYFRPRGTFMLIILGP
jgi:hypothetical protein